MWIGIDDTDSRSGGCTTHLAGIILSKLLKKGFHLINFPRLVRLNPNVPWKTRGNGAVSFQIAKGSGNPEKIGKIHSIDILSYPLFRKELNSSEVESVKKILVDIVYESAWLDEKNTNPGLVMVAKQFDEKVYWQTVRKIMDKQKMILYVQKQKGWIKQFKQGRGIIGAIASIAWNTNLDSTYELIAYRKKKQWGQSRKVDKKSVVDMDKKFQSTYDNYDYLNNHVNIMPNSPCPVLFGIRGDSASVLPDCMKMIRTESFDDWLIFASNQGSDNHLISTSIEKVKPFQSVILQGGIVKKPVTITGGHVIFSIRDEDGFHIDCAAYEPTKQFRHIVRKLEKGDSIQVYGGVREEPFTVNLEKIKINKLARVFEKVENPLCPSCGKHMKSIGRGKGFRCKKCKTKARKPKMVEKNRNLQEKLYEVPVSARRHLSKPIKRMENEKNMS